MGFITSLGDTLENLITGLGIAGRDKTRGRAWFVSEMSRAQCDAAYRGDWLARKIVDIPALDSTREWRGWRAEKDDIEALEREEKRLRVKARTHEAMRLARLDGGSVIFIGVTGDTELMEPLDPERLGLGSLGYLHVANRWDVGHGGLIRDVTSPWYGEPEYWSIIMDNGATVQVHPSRVLIFRGNERPDIWQSGHPWGDSVLQATGDAIKDANGAAQTIGSILAEAIVDVINVPGLGNQLSTAEGTARLQKRFGLMRQMKGAMGVALLDGEETYTRNQVSFAQLPEIISRYDGRAAAAADIPATRLLGQSPGGLNATGDSDLRNYYDRISSEQELHLSPQMERLDEVLIRSALGDRDESIWWEWSPLWQMDEKEQAGVAKTMAEAARIYADGGLVPMFALEKAVTSQMVESGVWPGLEAALEEAPAEPPVTDPDNA